MAKKKKLARRKLKGETVRQAVRDKKNMRLSMEYVPITELKRWEKNPRVNEEAAEKLCVLIEEYGFINPIIADKASKTIYAGDTRIQSAEALGYEELPVIFVPFDSEEAAELFAVADNKSSEWAKWNDDMLQELLGERKTLDAPKVQRMSGFTKLELEGLRTDTGDFAANTFAETVEKFGEQTPEKEKGWWVWVCLPGEKEFEQLLDKVGRAMKAKHSREMNFGQLFRVLGLRKGTVCGKCKGSGKAAEGKVTTKSSVGKRCQTCDGTGHLPLASGKKAKRKIRR